MNYSLNSLKGIIWRLSRGLLQLDFLREMLGVGTIAHMGDCQNYGPFFGSLCL